MVLLQSEHKILCSDCKTNNYCEIKISKDFVGLDNLLVQLETAQGANCNTLKISELYFFTVGSGERAV
jgi:hypothetical protein